MTDPLLLPERCRLVHIGPHKTGTTAVQWALHNARESLHEQGVHYAHHRPQAYKPAIALTGLPGRVGGPKVDDGPWLDLVAEIEAERERRVVVSSESFANARTEDIERLADDLGRDRVHIVRMLRRYDKMLPSQWQQNVSAGNRQTFANYLERVQSDPDHLFWERHGFANLTRRWADVVGPENVTTVVVDEGDHEWLLRVFERLTGLAEGTLRSPEERSNRSLTRGEVELLRRMNIIRAREDWADKVHFRYVRLAASPAMRTMPPDPEGGRITLPPEVLPMLAEATERDLADLLSLGVRVVGDTALLAPASPGSAPHPDADVANPSVALAGVSAAIGGVVRRAETKGTFPLHDDDARDRHDDDLNGDDDATEDAAEPGDPAVAVSTLRRTTELVVVPVPGPEGVRLRAVLAGAEDALRARKRRVRVVDGLEGVRRRRTHVVLVVVPPRQVLAGRWQEHVLGRQGSSYADWQPDHLDQEPFTDRLRAAVDAVGAKRVSVLVCNAFEPASTTRVLEQLAGLEPGTLEVQAPPRALLSWSESELLRRLDTDFREDGRSTQVWDRYVREGVLPWLLTATPAWIGRVRPLDEAAAQWVREESRRLVDALDDTGVRVLGNLDPLRRASDADVVPGADVAEPRIRPVTGALAVSGAIAATAPRD